MRVECFLDTNILLYAASKEPFQIAKRQIAARILQESKFGLSAQVIQEFYSNAVRKAEFDLNPSRALEWIEQFEHFPCVEISIALVRNAAVISQRHKISYWDGAIIAAADALGAPVLYTEDLSHGQIYGTVKAINPFIDFKSPTGFHEPEQAQLQ